MYDLWIEKKLTLFHFLLTKIDNENERNLRLYFRYETKSRLYFASTFDLYVIIETRNIFPLWLILPSEQEEP